MELQPAFHAPLLWLATALAAGCALGQGPALAWLVVGALGIAGAWLHGRRTAQAAAWLIVMFCLGGGLRAAADARAAERQAQALSLYRQPNARFLGVVERVLREDGIPRIQVRIKEAHSTDGITRFPARAVINLAPILAPPPEGSTIVFRAPLQAPRPAQFPGDFDAAGTLGAKGIELTGSIHGRDRMAVLANVELLSPVERSITNARAATRRLIRGNLPEDAAALTEAFVLGDASILGDDVRQPFDAAGASHLLAVSGLQATLLASLLFALLRALWGRVPWLLRRMDPGPAAAWACLPLIFAYAAYAGGAASVMRSAWMASALMASQIVRRKGLLAQALGAAAMVMLVLEPRAVHDAGFLLSFLSVLALGLIAPGLQELLGGESETTRGKLMAALGSSLAAYVATLPLVIHLFGRLAIYGSISNVLLIPVGAVALPAVVVMTLLAVLLGNVFLVKAAGAVGVALLEVCRAIASLPGAMLELPPPPGWLVAVALVGALMLGVGNRRGARVGTALMLIGILGGFLPTRGTEGILRVMMAPVGQGDGSIVITPLGDVVVVDAGGSFISEVDPGKRVMLPILQRMGVQKLKAVILSHPHPDHQNGLVTLVEELKPEELWWSGQSSRHPRFTALMDAAQRAGTRIVLFDRPSDGGAVRRELGGATFHVLHPLPFRDAEDAPRYFPEFDENDNSLVVRISFGDTNVLFPGDIEHHAEELLTEPDSVVRPLLKAHVLKIPHHGSTTSTSEALLDAVQPSHALMGVGINNQWGFPHPDVVERLIDRGVHIWRTDEDGLINVELDGKDVRVSAFRR